MNENPYTICFILGGPVSAMLYLLLTRKVKRSLFGAVVVVLFWLSVFAALGVWQNVDWKNSQIGSG
jgi:hypothetical protein